MTKRAVAKRPTRRPLKKRVEDVQRRVEDRVGGLADKAMDIVEANLDAWMDMAVVGMLAKVGLVPPESVSVRGEGGKVIELVKRADGTYAAKGDPK